MLGFVARGLLTAMAILAAGVATEVLADLAGFGQVVLSMQLCRDLRKAAMAAGSAAATTYESTLEACAAVPMPQ